MCAGCMTSAEFVLTSGALSVGALRIGLRSLRPTARVQVVSDEEAAAFVARIAARPAPQPLAPVIALPVLPPGPAVATTAPGQQACA